MISRLQLEEQISHLGNHETRELTNRSGKAKPASRPPELPDCGNRNPQDWWPVDFFHSTGSPSRPNKVQNVQRISKVCHPLTVFNSWRLHQISRTSLRFLGSGPKGFWPEQRKRFLRTRTKFGQEAFCQHVKRLRNALSKTRTIRRSTKPEFWLQLGM